MNTTANWVTEPLKKKRGRPKKTENVAKPPKRKRGRPKKVKDDSIVLQQPVAVKRKRGRPKKVFDISTFEWKSNDAKAKEYKRKERELVEELKNPEKRKKYNDIVTNKLIDILKPPTNKKTYTYIIEAKVRVVED